MPRLAARAKSSEPRTAKRSWAGARSRFPPLQGLLRGILGKRGGQPTEQGTSSRSRLRMRPTWSLVLQPARKEANVMGTILIDKLLSAASQAGGERSAHHRRPAAGAAAAWSAAEAQDQGARADRHHGPDEEHHARPLPAGISGDRQHRLRLRVWRSGPVPRLGLSAAGQRGDGAAADSRRSMDDGQT